ncbi:RsmD family RNA methyltransferase, partial [Candidatus Dojkabacteria bacterium]|nr:RsmD family RNA methyltransferase [Candidatus Dojkabacteria bacterium]
MANNLPHIISGTAKGKKLQVAAGTRPLTGRIKQSLFGLLGFDNPGQDFSSTTVLDLFAGSGSFGLEALSRGAKSAVFVE